MSQPPHSVNRSGLNHRETSHDANVFLLGECKGLAGRREGVTFSGAVVITLADARAHWRNKV